MTTLTQFRRRHAKASGPASRAKGPGLGEETISIEQLYAHCEFLERELELRDAALNASSTYFALIDVKREDRPIVFCNRSFARDHGYEPGELTGHSIAELASREGNDKALEELRVALKEGRGARAELIARARDGRKFIVGVQMHPLSDDSGSISHYVCVGADITIRLEAERKKQELQEQLHSEIRERERLAIELRLAQKLESVGRLAAGVAHEINTPIQYVGDSVHFLRTSCDDLNVLLGLYEEFARAVAAGEPTEALAQEIAAAKERCDFDFVREEMPRAFERTLDGVDRVTHIVRAMKEFSHPDESVQSQSDINRAIQTTLTMAHNEYKYLAQVQCELGDLPGVMCNLGELNQVFLNMIVNAAHAIEAAGKDASTGVIKISSRHLDDQVEIVISDNGCGIKEEDREKIFDPFFTTKEVGKGTGQGLTIARSIVVERHGGELDFQSAEGVGTTFVIRLPVNGVASKEEA